MNDGTQPIVWDVIERHKHRAGDLFRQPLVGEEFPLKRCTYVSQEVEAWEEKRVKGSLVKRHLQQQCLSTTTTTKKSHQFSYKLLKNDCIRSRLLRNTGASWLSKIGRDRPGEIAHGVALKSLVWHDEQVRGRSSFYQ